MPLGGGDIGLNVWAENETILFYVAKDGCFDENNSILKLGRIRLQLDPNPFTEDRTFEQRLLLEDGYVQFRGGDGAELKIWIDVFCSSIHVEILTSTISTLTASLESWRFQDRQMNVSEQAQSSWGTTPNISTYTLRDNITFWSTSILSSHRNIDTRLFDATLAQQQLTDHKDQIDEPTANNTFGLLMYGSGLSPADTTMGHYVNTSFQSWNLRSTQAQTSFNLTIVTHQNQTQSYKQWQDELFALNATAATTTQSATIEWWNNFWNRSYILVNANNSEDDPSFQVGRNYQLFRYMLGCNAMSKWPSRFNGGLFTFDPVFANPEFPFTPDFRRWGGGTYTAQNQRLEYWPLLKSNDIDVMIPQFEFYRRIVDTGLLRGRSYRNINHSTFSEQIDNSGLPQLFNFDADTFIYGTQRPTSFNSGDEFNAWIIWLGDTAASPRSPLHFHFRRHMLILLWL